MALIFLTGMPGSGKSYWMQQLSFLYNCTGLDMDHAIEKYSGKTIAQLFDKGETYFREAEHAVLNNIVKSAHCDTIIATGGGTPCFYNNIDMMNRHGISIYLKATVELLTRNILQSQDERPLLKSAGIPELSDKIKDLLYARERFYKQATITIAAEMVSLATFARILQPHISE